MTMDINDYTVSCGYFTCDTRYEFCSRAFVEPECHQCSGICFPDQTVNDPQVAEYCRSLCPEYWRQIHDKSSTEDLIREQTLSWSSVNNMITAIIGLVVLLILLVVTVLLINIIQRSTFKCCGHSKGEMVIENEVLPVNSVTAVETSNLPEGSLNSNTMNVTSVSEQSALISLSTPVSGHIAQNGYVSLPVYDSSSIHYAMATDHQSHLTSEYHSAVNAGGPSILSGTESLRSSLHLSESNFSS